MLTLANLTTLILSLPVRCADQLMASSSYSARIGKNSHIEGFFFVSISFFPFLANLNTCFYALYTVISYYALSINTIIEISDECLIIPLVMKELLSIFLFLKDYKVLFGLEKYTLSCF